jgi:uncharacterized protein (TIGR02646 family)
MIRVNRSAKPDILVKKETEWLNALLTASTPATQERAMAKYRHQQIQRVLKQMFHGKCAYCESHVEHVSDAHIEHYRPKSRFRHLTFDWDNLLLACGKGNSIQYKSDKFPEADEGGPIVNPCVDDPDEHLDFQYDERTKLASVYGKTVRGRTTETLLGLNRAELRQYRSRQVTRLAALACLARTHPEAHQLLEEARQDDAEYAAFARAL